MSLIDKDTLRTAFREFFGFASYDFQIEVAQTLLNGQSVVLQAPTGAGKTNTALFPFLYARKNLKAQDFPRKMLYSVERKILVNNFYQETEKLLDKLKIPGLETSVLTGERLEDREMTMGAVFTTIDQTLSSVLMIPYSLSSRIANLNAGAVCSSYLVFDEAHLFDSQTALPTLMWMLQTLKGVVPSLLMTATFSEPILYKLADITGGKVITVSKDELKEIKVQATKKRYFKAVPHILTAADVLQQHRTRSIVVCNTVDRAQLMYDELEAAIEAQDSDAQLVLLHARFWKSDRKKHEDKLMRLFGRRDDKDTDTAGSYILIATQVIEVGVDITSENLHTELAPANTILQRAGRCARHENEEGTVWVYQVEKPLPYKEDAELFDPTFETIANFGQQPITFPMEQTLINAVHTEKDTHTLEQIRAGFSTHIKKIEETLTSLEPKYSRDLIRDADSRSILIHPFPEEIENPYEYESFSIFDGTFKGKLSDLQAQVGTQGVNWAVRWPEYVPDEADKEQLQRRPTRYEWKKMEKPSDIKWQPTVVVNPLLVSYDSKRGFSLNAEAGKPCPSSPEIDRENKKRRRFDYVRETYAEHIQNVNWAYGYYKLDDEVAYAVAMLHRNDQLRDLPAGQIERAIRLSFVFHDAGKLTQGWQGVVHKWQQEVNDPVESNIMLAHTYFEWQKHQQLEQDFQKHGNRRPPHAVEGAITGSKFLFNALGKQLYRPVISAIARHHAPTAEDVRPYQIHTAAAAALNEALKIMQDGQVWSLKPEQLMQVRPADTKLPENLQIKVSSSTDWLLYALIVRVLRLADQRSFDYHKIHLTNGE